MKDKVKKSSIKEKLLKSFKSMSRFAFVIGILGIISIVLSNFLYIEVLQKYGFVQGNIGKFQAEVEKSKYYLSQLVNITDNGGKKYYTNKLDDSNSAIEVLLPQIEASCSMKDEKDKYAEIIKNKEEYGQSVGKIIELNAQNKNNEAKNILNKEGVIIIDSMEESINDLMIIKVDKGDKSVAFLKVVCISTLAITILMVIIIMRKARKTANKYAKEIADPISSVTNLAKEIAEGNLNVDISIDSDDEIGELGKTFKYMSLNLNNYIYDISEVLENISNKNLNISIEHEYKGDFNKIKESLNSIIDSLNEVFKEIKNATNEVNGGADQVSSTAQVTSEGATNQAAQVEELLASIQEINVIVHNNMEKVESTNNIYQDIVREVESQNQNITELVGAMEEIKKSSNDIKGIIGAIEEIAEQTDLLALNAAIEAARVGEAGKGFVVVSEEIRELSNQSSSSVNKTKELIEKAINVSLNGKNLVDTTTKGILEVIGKIKESSKLINNIAEESSVQSEKIEEINNVILQVSDVVSSNSAIAEESAAASEELNAQAANLDNMISKFNLR